MSALQKMKELNHKDKAGHGVNNIMSGSFFFLLQPYDVAWRGQVYENRNRLQTARTKISGKTEKRRNRRKVLLLCFL